MKSSGPNGAGATISAARVTSSELGRALAHGQVEFVDGRIGQRLASAVPTTSRVTLGLIDDLIARPQEVLDLVVVLGLDRLHERDEIRRGTAQSVAQHLAALRPLSVAAPQVLYRDAQAVAVSNMHE